MQLQNAALETSNSKVILGALVAESPRCTLSSNAMKELDQAISLYELGSEPCRPPATLVCSKCPITPRHVIHRPLSLSFRNCDSVHSLPFQVYRQAAGSPLDAPIVLWLTSSTYSRVARASSPVLRPIPQHQAVPRTLIGLKTSARILQIN